jgi:hypothetical protein
MRFYLLRDPGWYIEAVGDFLSHEEAQAAMVGDRVPPDWLERLDAGEYAGRYHINDHEELADQLATAVQNDPELLLLIQRGLMEDFTDPEAEELFHMMKERPDLKLSEAVAAVRMKTRFLTLRSAPDTGPSPALIGSD